MFRFCCTACNEQSACNVYEKYKIAKATKFINSPHKMFDKNP